MNKYIQELEKMIVCNIQGFNKYQKIIIGVYTTCNSFNTMFGGNIIYHYKFKNSEKYIEINVDFEDYFKKLGYVISFDEWKEEITISIENKTYVRKYDSDREEIQGYSKKLDSKSINKFDDDLYVSEIDNYTKINPNQKY